MEKTHSDSESHQTARKQDPQNNMALRTFIRENYDVKKYFSNSPSHKTPPSTAKATKPFNPFNYNLKERLENATFSPSVFDKVLSSREASSTEFKLTIDDISKCNPADIDEESQNDVIDDNEETREDVQQAIDRYFSQTHMPSPWNVVPRDFSSPMTSTPGSGSNIKKDNMMSSTPKKSEQRIKFVTSVSTQTTLSLPAKLPDHIEELLKPYFIDVKDDDYDSVEEEESLSASNLRRKLDFSGNHFSLKRFEADDSMGSDTSLNDIEDRYVGTPLPMVSSPDVSPIQNGTINRRNSNFSSRLNFTQDMHVCTFSAEGNDESESYIKKNEESAMSLTVDMQMDENDRHGPVALVAATELPSQDIGYQTGSDVAALSGSCSQDNCSEELMSKETISSDVTYGWTGFSHHLEEAQKDHRHATAASTPTKITKSFL